MSQTGVLQAAADQTLGQLVDSLSAKTAAPGGGTAAAVSATMGSALMLMVVRFSRSRPANADREADLARAEGTLQRHLDLMRSLPDRDCAAFAHMATAYGMERQTDREREIRNKAIEEALHGLIVVPEETLCLVRDVFVAIDEVTSCIGRNLITDLGTASELLRASADAAFLNVRINVGYMQDKERAQQAAQRVLAVREEVLRHHDSLRGVIDALL